MRILVTGSNGLLGQKLLKQLIEIKEYEVIATSLGNDRSTCKGDLYQYHALDITQKGEVQEIVRNYHPEIVINTAAMTQVDACEQEHEECWNLNVNAVKHLVDVCLEHDTFLIHLSTDFIFDGEAGPYKETDKPHPVSFYGESKLESEKVILESNLKASILRTVLVYGYEPSLSRTNIILWVKKSLEEGKPIRVVTDQWRTPTLAEDLARACILSAEKRIPGIFNISGKEMMTPYDMAMEVADFFGLDKSLISAVDGSVFSQPAKRPPKTGFILDKAQNLLGYEPTSFRAGLELISSQLLND